jgi:hypothetical protein
MTKSLKQFTELDFFRIKESLKTFLEQQEQFKDYNFEGSNLNTLLDLLSYNTQYNAFYSNMWFSEHFIDSAQLRSSVVGLARNLGYVPRSTRSASATVRVTFNVVDGFTGSLSIPVGTTFSGTTADGDSFLFQTDEEYIVNPVSGVYTSDLEIFEGNFFRYTEVIKQNENGVTIPNPGVDVERMNVFVRDSQSATTRTQYEKSTDYTQLNNESEVYFIEEVENRRYRVYFGDGVIGLDVIAGNVVDIEYFVANGEAANAIKVFALESSIQDVDSVTISTLSASSGGREPESIDSVRVSAPVFYQTQNRAVTTTDYKAIILQNFTNVEDAVAWGGEDNVPADYGKVYISLKPLTGQVLSDIDKQNIVTFLIDNYSIVSIIPVPVDPQFIEVFVTTEVFYDSTKTNPGGAQIQSNVVSTIVEFSNENLEKFDAALKYSRLVRAIDDSDPSIINSNTEVSISIDVGDQTTIPNNNFSFFNAMQPGTLESNIFDYNGLSQIFIKDDGIGNLKLFRVINGVVQEIVPSTTIGSIDYNTGNIVFDLNTFLVNTITLTTGNIRINGQTDSFDIDVERNQLCIIDAGDIKVKVTDTQTGLSFEGS